ncbi:hypothetical protein ACHAPG_007330 [Botrytis cinerea]
MSDHYTLTRTQRPDKNPFKFWERQLFARMRLKRGLMGELDGLDLEGAKKLQDASDEVIAQIREDFVQKSSDEERMNWKLIYRKSI